MGDQPRNNRERSPWALISISIVIILFGFFWWWQQKQVMEEINASVILPTFNKHSAQAAHPDTQFDLSFLQASAVNISIPSFEKAL